MLVVALLIAAQVSVSFLVKTHRVRAYLITHLQRAFGRPVQAGDLSVQILPVPELEVEAVTIGEDPGFGHEYFLRAERMTASIRWSGLLHRHFEFGTMSLRRPSLILVRNAAGRWNLEDWLPPARAKADVTAPTAGSSRTAESTHHLQKIEFDEGRINFKVGDEKGPFAFTEVSGSVEQESPGRWELRLEAQPWRSGVTLQSTGTLQVAGDVAGTSARLQPAQLRLHWDKVSLADLFRLATGNDSGVRGVLAVDASARAGAVAASAEAESSQWRFQLEARATQIHRWDLTERDDNPRINVKLNGSWNLAAAEGRAEDVRVELPRSNLNGSAVIKARSPASWEVQFKSLSLRTEDLLAWYRAFQPDIADEVAVAEQITGSLRASGWPLTWEDGTIAGGAGTLRAPGLSAARIEPFHGTVRNGKFSLEGPRVRFAAEMPRQAAGEKTERGATKARSVAAPENSVEVALLHDSVAHQGGVRLNLHLADTSPLFKLAAAFGHKVNSGWEYTGGASGTASWNWGNSFKEMHHGGSVDLTKAQLQVAGLNQPLKIEETHLEWKEGRRGATVGKAEAFGAQWSGTISEAGPMDATAPHTWRFQLHADHLDAAELDRWFGPRARPNWLQRLLPSLLGKSNAPARASELLRQVSAEGELTTDTLSAEKIKLANVRAALSLRNLELHVRGADADWAGGSIHCEVQAAFFPLPKYEMSAEVERVNLAQLPWTPRWAERWSGTASGKIHLTTGGVGREELLKQLAGRGELKLNKVEWRGWDVESSAESGATRAGVSRWARGQGEFEIGERELRFDAIRLNASHRVTQLAGKIGFDMSGNLTFQLLAPDRRNAKKMPATHEFSVSGPLDTPKVAVRPVSAAQTRP